MIGDHIRARKGGRWSHAIDLGDQTVILFSEDPGTPAGDRVRRCYKPDFVAGAEAVEVVIHRERVFAPRQVAARALSRRRDPALEWMFSGSAAFAEWCKAGRLEAPPNLAVAAPAPAAAKPVKRAALKVAPRQAAAKKPAPKPRPASKKPTRKAKAKPAAKPAPKKAAAKKVAKKKPALKKPAPKPLKKAAGTRR